MKIKTVIAAAAAVMLCGNLANAAHVWEDSGGWWSDHFVADRSNAPRFSANEFSLDLFGSYAAAERGFGQLFNTNIRNGHWGGGVGINYFFSRYIGIGGDINMSDNGHNLVDIMEGSLIARLPIDSAGLAPYIFGGGGRMTEPWDWTLHAGVGLEWRFNPSTGIFTDARYIWSDESGDGLLIRAGLRIAL